MQSQMLFTTMWGPPPAETPPPIKPVTHFDLCWKCKPSFNTSYCLYLPEWECTNNKIESIMEPSSREYCVDYRVMLDGHTVKLANKLVDKRNSSLDALFYLPGAHYVTVGHHEAPVSNKDARRKFKAAVKVALEREHAKAPSHASNNSGHDDAALVIERLSALLEDAQAENQLLRAELDEDHEKFEEEALRWTDLFNHKPHLFGAKATVEYQPPAENNDSGSDRIAKEQMPTTTEAARATGPAAPGGSSLQSLVTIERCLGLLVCIIFIVFYVRKK